MRKILSIILTAAMTLSLFAAIPLGASAAASGSAITFETPAETDYYDGSGKNSSAAPQDSGTAQGKAFKYSVIPQEWDYDVKASALRIAQNNSDGTVSAYNVTPGKSYSISFKYKNDKELTSWNVYTKLLYVDSASNMGDFLHTANKAPGDWNPQSGIQLIAGAFGEQRVPVTDGWVDYSSEFTVPTDITNTELALVFVADSTVTDASLWVDDILVTDLSPSSEPTMKFDSANETSYYTNPAGQNCSADGIQYSGTAQGKAFKYSVIPQEWDYNVKASALRIAQNNSDGTVSAYNVTPGKRYSISFKYKNDKELTSWGIYAMLLYVDSASNMGDFLHTANAVPGAWNQKSGIQHIAGALGEQRVPVTDGWVDYSSEFTVPTDITNTELELVFVADSTVTDASLWVDDILVTDLSPSSEPTMKFDSANETSYYTNPAGQNCSADGIQYSGTAQGKAFKYSVIPQEWDYNVKASALRIAQNNSDGTVSAYNVTPGKRYSISFKYKNDKELTSWGIYAMLLYVDSASNMGDFLHTANAVPGAWNQKSGIQHIAGALGEQRVPVTDGWVDYSSEFTVPTDITNTELELVFVADNTVTDASLWIDDISITQKTTVKVHNSSIGDFTFLLDYGTKINTIKFPFPNVKAVKWYKDAEHTQIFEGTVGYDDLELWVDIENIVGDFENGYDAAKDGWDGNTFNTEQYAGTTNSTALTNKGQAQSGIDNSAYPPVIKLINSDGSDFTTVSGHNYKLSFDLKPVDSTKLNTDSQVIVMKNPNKQDGAPDFDKYTKLGTKYPTDASIYYSYGQNAADDRDHYKTFEFTFTGTGNKVYIASYLAGTAVYFDNINIIDLTAQLDVIDSEGNVLASGLDGETVTIPDAADPDFVYYAENGAPVSTTVVRKAKALTKVNSQIAVTGSTFDRNNSTVSFTTRFGGIGYTEANGGVTVNTITVENTRYFVEDMGLLVAPTANVTGELTLDNLGNAIQISGTNLRYSAKGTDELQVTAQIKTGKYDRDYTVVGYVKCAGGKVIYSKTRNSIAKSYNAAAGIESVDNTLHTKTIIDDTRTATYTLVSNSEFNSAESLSNGWNTWGYKSTKPEMDADGNVIANQEYSYYSTDSATYVDNGNLVLDPTKTGDKTYDAPELLSKYFFTTGYLEVKATYENISDLSGAIWLNSVALSDDQLVIKPNATDTHVRPEIDILEFTQITNFYTTLHSWGTDSNGNFGNRTQIRLTNRQQNTKEPTLDLENAHIFGLERTAEAIRIYIDGVKHYELTYEVALQMLKAGTWPLDNRTENEVKALFVNPTYLILGLSGAKSLSVGDSAKGTIDYVRFYQ